MLIEERERAAAAANAQKLHKLTISNRRSGVLSGIIDVLSFDVGEILLETQQGMLMIKGNDLHVKRLSLEKGEVDVEGRIDSLAYSDLNPDREKESFLGRLFK